MTEAEEREANARRRAEHDARVSSGLHLTPSAIAEAERQAEAARAARFAATWSNPRQQLRDAHAAREVAEVELVKWRTLLTNATRYRAECAARAHEIEQLRG
jgi:hypothetical protein